MCFSWGNWSARKNYFLCKYWCIVIGTGPGRSYRCGRSAGGDRTEKAFKSWLGALFLYYLVWQANLFFGHFLGRMSLRRQASKSQEKSSAALQNFRFIFIPTWDSPCKTGDFCLLGSCSCIPSSESCGASVGNASFLSCAWFVHF